MTGTLLAFPSLPAAEPDEGVRIRLFGVLRVTSGGRALGPRDLGGAKPKQLLQLLALADGRLVSRDALADAIWGDKLPKTWMATLDGYVSLLRGALEPGVKPAESIIETHRGAYRLAAERVWCDLHAFETAVSSLDRDDAPLGAVLHVLSLVNGTLVEDEPYAEWALARRERTGLRVVDVCLVGARRALRGGDAWAALDLAERALASDGLAEDAMAMAIEALLGLNRRDLAARRAAAYTKRLADELDLQPGIALQAAIDAITAPPASTTAAKPAARRAAR